MAKLTQAEKTSLKLLKDCWPGVQFEQCAVSGITVARVPHGSEFNKVTIAYCGPGDKFSKKRGKLEALRRLENDNFVLMPKYSSFDNRFEVLLEML